MNKALFVLIDETLITTKSGRSFPLNSEDWKFKTNFISIFKDAISKGYKIILIDNQFSIGDGFMSEKAYINKLNYISSIIERDLELPENSIAYFYCSDKNDIFRALPCCGMFYEAALEYEIILGHSVMLCTTEEEQAIASFGGLLTAYTIFQIPFISLT
jgi:histidinol phosphatase-like enzyme